MLASPRVVHAPEKRVMVCKAGDGRASHLELGVSVMSKSALMGIFITMVIAVAGVLLYKKVAPTSWPQI